MPDEYVHPFVEPGVLRVSDAVVEKLREYAREHPLWPRDVPRLPTISWYDENRIRTPGTNEWRELGPGLMPGWSDTVTVPANCVHVVDGFEFAVEMLPHILARASERRIDSDDTAPTGFVLR
jgi:hypothetical protein